MIADLRFCFYKAENGGTNQAVLRLFCSLRNEIIGNNAGHLHGLA
jgi:hypothetical protein